MYNELYEQKARNERIKNMRIDVRNASAIKMEEQYYIIEYKSSGKWHQLIDQFFLPEYEFGQNTSCGDCWQKTGQHGMYDVEYAKEYCNKLNKAIENGTLNSKFEISEFRVAKIEWTFKKEVLIPNKY